MVDAEDGLATTQLVLVFPAVMLLVLLVVQYALVWHAKQLVDAAADQGAHAAAAADDGRDPTVAARQFVAGGADLSDVDVAVSRNAGRVVVRVAATAPRVVPMGSWRVAGEAAAPVERFVPEDQRR